MDRRGRLLRALHATLLASSSRRSGGYEGAAAAATTAARLFASSTPSAPSDGGAAAGATAARPSSRPRKTTTPNTTTTSRRALFSALAEPAPRPTPIPRSRLAGQPTPSTHPELLRPGELLPGVRAEEFARRRAALAALLPPDSVAVIPAQAISFVTGVIPHPYRQDADFAYLTGVQQQAVAVIATGPAPAPAPSAPRIASSPSASSPPPPSTPPSSFTYSLFVPQPDRDRETWDGAWLGRDAAQEVFGVSPGCAHHAHELAARLVPLLASARAVFFDLDRQGGYLYGQVRAALEEVARRASQQQQQQQRSAAAAGPSSSSSSPPSAPLLLGGPRVHALRPLMHRLRWVKSPAEVALMAASASAAADSVTACMAATSPGAREASLAALFEYRCRLRGASRCAYPSVVASGSDSCTIHYSRNDKVCRSGDLLLMDAGCELHGYASDVTRTWPVSGKFSGAQRQLYAVVLAAREKVLAAAVEGASLARLHALCVSLLSQGLLDLGLLRGMSLDAVMAGPYKEFFCHSVGHALGLDVHDASAVGPARPLEAGVALALEPGLYVPDDPRRFGPFAGLGIRLEDDVVIAPGGEPPTVLSAAAPIEMDDVEHAVGRKAL